MDVHQNARLTLHCREMLMERVLRGRPKRCVAAESGISAKTVGKWVRRFQAEGATGLRDRSCRPQRCPAYASLRSRRACRAAGEAYGPASFDWGAPLELETEFREELDGGTRCRRPRCRRA